jgi:ABC-2 type transport system ATP-binding protein
MPEILILDEPTLGLDPPSRAKIWDYIKMLNTEKGMTILITTHYLEEAEKLADYVYIMDKGVIVEEGNPKDLIKKLGNDTIRLKGSGKLDEFKSALATKDNIKSISISKNEIIYIGVQSGQIQLPEIFEIASQKQFIIREVEIDKPNLGDVFFNCTGKEIIESKGGLK